MTIESISRELRRYVKKFVLEDTGDLQDIKISSLPLIYKIPDDLLTDDLKRKGHDTMYLSEDSLDDYQNMLMRLIRDPHAEWLKQREKINFYI